MENDRLAIYSRVAHDSARLILILLGTMLVVGLVALNLGHLFEAGVLGVVGLVGWVLEAKALDRMNKALYPPINAPWHRR